MIDEATTSVARAVMAVKRRKMGDVAIYLRACGGKPHRDVLLALRDAPLVIRHPAIKAGGDKAKFDKLVGDLPHHLFDLAIKIMDRGGIPGPDSTKAIADWLDPKSDNSVPRFQFPYRSRTAKGRPKLTDERDDIEIVIFLASHAKNLATLPKSLVGQAASMFGISDRGVRQIWSKHWKAVAARRARTNRIKSKRLERGLLSATMLQSRIRKK